MRTFLWPREITLPDGKGMKFSQIPENSTLKNEGISGKEALIVGGFFLGVFFWGWFNCTSFGERKWCRGQDWGTPSMKRETSAS